ncbi:hypothetical protein Efla_000572 [Eimeria flavescens]
MKDRPAYDLRTPLKYWNLTLAVFSLVGMVRIVPQLGLLIWQWGFECSIVGPPVYAYGHGAAGLWTLLFIYSKFVELLDTLFIILRKKPLSFLHWYHHATVLLYTWDAYTCEQPAGIYFVAMNYSVHAVMYFYYFLAAQLHRPLSWGIFVTIAQISQMFVGVGVTVVSMFYALAYPYQPVWHADQLSDPLSHGHYITLKNLYWACLMYSTYFYLFAEYFVRRYIKGKAAQAKTQKATHDKLIRAPTESASPGAVAAAAAAMTAAAAAMTAAAAAITAAAAAAMAAAAAAAAAEADCSSLRS